MNITKFEANNFKRLTAVSIAPDGNVITLTGDNGAGKSSVLDGIMATMAGGKSIPEKPIRDGQESGEIVVTLSNGLIVTRRFTPGGSTLRVEDASGIKRSPQGIMDAVIGELSFDPLAFTRMKEGEQGETLRILAKLNFSTLDREHEQVYTSRTLTNRDLDAAEVHLKGLKPFDSSAPLVETSAADVMAEIDAAQAKNNVADGELERANSARRYVEDQKKEIAEAEAQIVEWKKILEARKIELGNRIDAFVALDKSASAAAEKRVEVAPLKEKLSKLEENNAKVRNNTAVTLATARHIKLRDEAAGYTKRLDEINSERAKMLREAQYPLPGLSYKDGKVFFNGIPFSQISAGEKLRISVAVGMALNPSLKVIFVRDGSLLDAAGLKLVAEMATANGYQVWIEDARSTDPAAVVIEEGSVVKK